MLSCRPLLFKAQVLSVFFHERQRIVAESCEVALDVYKSEQANEFQYANGIEELVAAH